MSLHPANLILRFFLEMAGLVSLGLWGWSQGQGIFRYILAILAPLVAAFLWGTLAVPGDQTRDPNPPVPIPGFLRLALEICFFGFAVWGLAAAGSIPLAVIFGLLILFHYAISYDRVAWLFHRGEPRPHGHPPRQK